MAMVEYFNGYFDEVGTHGGSPITGIGGYVGRAEAWGRVEGPWQAVLDEYADKGVKWFHMSEALAQDGQFARVDRPGINYIITQLAQRLGNEPLAPFFAAVENEAWDAVVIDPEFLKRFPTPADLCFENIVQKLWQWGRDVAGELIVPMFAYSTELTPRMAEIGRLYGAHDWYKSVLGALAFDYPQRVIGLQAADLIAHQMWRDTAKRRRPLTLDDMGQTNALVWATNGKFVQGNILTRNGLELTMQRFKEAGYPSGPVGLF